MFMTQAKVELSNGNGLSVVNGEYAYCNDETYEIAPLLNGELFYVDNWGDQVKGYVTPDEITKILTAAELMSPEKYKEFLEEFFNR